MFISLKFFKTIANDKNMHLFEKISQIGVDKMIFLSIIYSERL